MIRQSLLFLLAFLVLFVRCRASSALRRKFLLLARQFFQGFAELCFQHLDLFRSSRLHSLRHRLFLRLNLLQGTLQLRLQLRQVRCAQPRRRPNTRPAACRAQGMERARVRGAPCARAPRTGRAASGALRTGAGCARRAATRTLRAVRARTIGAPHTRRAAAPATTENSAIRTICTVASEVRTISTDDGLKTAAKVTFAQSKLATDIAADLRAAELALSPRRASLSS